MEIRGTDNRQNGTGLTGFLQDLHDYSVIGVYQDFG